MEVEAGGEGGEEGGGDVAKEETGVLKRKVSKTPKIWVLEAQKEAECIRIWGFSFWPAISSQEHGRILAS
ncbi:hypothetical protein CJ030_MR2G020039 [Morella rubra]|nr:hypothetical protein CJ030_MR0G007869 [Morella rubra]KAB1222988.1 hypothetical protein CJ030_MR2G020039 [Morella rubra]